MTPKSCMDTAYVYVRAFPHPKIADNKLQGWVFRCQNIPTVNELENQKEGNSSDPTITIVGGWFPNPSEKYVRQIGSSK